MKLDSICLILIILFTTSVHSQCCLRFSDPSSSSSQSNCIQCPQKMHLYRGNCIIDITGCLSYDSGFDCVECTVDSQLINNECRKIVKIQELIGEKKSYKWQQLVSTDNSIKPIQIYGRSQLQKSISDSNIKKQTIKLTNVTLQNLKQYSNKQLVIFNYKYTEQRNNRQLQTQYQVRILRKLNGAKDYKIIKINSTNTFKQSIKLQQIDIQDNRQHYYQTRIIGFFVRKQKNDIGEIIGGTVTKLSNGYSEYKLRYGIQQSNQQYQVIAEISDNQDVQIKNINKISDKSNNYNLQQTSNSDILIDINRQQFMKSDDWMILKDLIATQYSEKYGNGDPIFIKKYKSDIHNKKYQLCYKCYQNRQCFLNCEFLDEYTIKIQEQSNKQNQSSKLQYTSSSTQNRLLAKQVSQSQLQKDFYYWLGITQYSQQNTYYRKYIDSDTHIVSAALYQRKGQFCEYWVVYQLSNGSTQQIYFKFDVKNLKTVSIEEIKGQIQQDNYQNHQSYQKDQQQDTNKQTDSYFTENTDNSYSQPNIQNPIVNTQHPKSPTQQSTTTNTNTTPFHYQQQSSHEPIKPNKTNSPPQIPQSIINSAIGLTKIDLSQYYQSNIISDNDLKSVNDMVSLISSSKQLRNSSIIAAYYRMNAFIRSYYIFYVNKENNKIYQAMVSRDLLRRQNYLISFDLFSY